MEELIISAIRGAISGGIYGLAGYGKNADKEFDLNGFIRAPIVGAVIGGFAGYSGIEFDSAYEVVAASGVIAVIDMGIKALTRRYGDRIMELAKGE